MSSFRLKGAFHRSSHSFTRQWRQRALKHVSLKVLGVALLLLHALFKVIGIICSLAFASLVASSNAIDCVCVVGIIPFCSQELISRSHLWYSKHYIITTKYSLILLVKYFNKKVFTHLAGQVFQQKSIHTSCWSSISTKYSLILGSIHYNKVSTHLGFSNWLSISILFYCKLTGIGLFDDVYHYSVRPQSP